MATQQATHPVSTDLTVGTRAVVVVTASGRPFATKVSDLKRWGAQYDPAGKVWVLRITEGNVNITRFLRDEDGGYTGYRVIDNAEWIARRAGK